MEGLGQVNGSLRIWGLICGAAVVAVLAGGFFVGVQPALASAAQIDQQTAALNSQNQNSMITLAALSKQGAKLSDMQAEQKVLLKAVPSILKPNTFIRRVNEVAAIDNVTVQGIALSEAQMYTAPASAGEATTAAVGTNGASGSPSTVTTSTTSAGSPSALVTTDPSITAQNFAVIPATVQVSGAPSALLQFAHDIQTDERVFVITTISSTTDTTGASSTSFGGLIYTLQR
jgi:Tfp pilus assembly protein PilO